MRLRHSLGATSEILASGSAGDQVGCGSSASPTCDLSRGGPRRTRVCRSRRCSLSVYVCVSVPKPPMLGCSMRCQVMHVDVWRRAPSKLVPRVRRRFNWTSAMLTPFYIYDKDLPQSPSTLNPVFTTYSRSLRCFYHHPPLIRDIQLSIRDSEGAIAC